MQKYKILFVDDDKQILSIVEQFLTRCGFTVDTESNGHKAIDRVTKTESYSVVFTDLMMPDIGGITLLKEIKKRHTDTEVIIVTGTDLLKPQSKQ
jgi:DNA-binding NtrC family response regulator